MISRNNAFVLDAGLSGYDLMAAVLGSLSASGNVSNLLPDIVGEALDDLHLSAPTPPAVEMQGNEGDKYRVASCLQKAIRRGDGDMAARCAVALHLIDQTYLWRRLSVIVMEDVGVCGLRLSVVVNAFASQKRLRDKYGGKAVALYVVDQMVKTIKDRSLCETSNASNTPRLQSLKDSFFGDHDPTFGQLFHVYTHRIDGPGTRYLYGKKLAGLLSRSDARGKREYASGYRGEFLQSLDALQLPPVAQLALELGIKAGAEGLPLAIPLALEKFGDDWPACNVQCPELPASPIIRGLLSCAYDKHTFEGKRAIKRWIAATLEIWSWLDENLSENVNREAVVASGLFYCEGGMKLDKFLNFPYWRNILLASMKSESERYQLPLPKLMELYWLLPAHFDSLHEERRKTAR